MKRIQTASAVPDKFGAGKPGFKDGDPETGVVATDLEAAFFDQVQESIVRTIEEAQMALSSTDMDQYVTALKTIIEKRVVTPSVAGGTANALTVTVATVLTALVNGHPFTVISAAANTAGVTAALTLGTTALPGTLPIVKGNNLPLQPGDIPVAGYPMRLNYSSAYGALVLSNPALGLGNADSIGKMFDWPVGTAPTNGLLANGAAVSSATYAALFAVMVKKLSGATISIASPAVVGWAAHGRAANSPVKFTTTGTLPTGVVAGTTYYVAAAGLSTDSFQISATIGGAVINTTGSQSGVHTVINAPYGCANDLSTFNVPNVPADYTTVQASANEGTTTVGVVISHTHEMGYSDGVLGTAQASNLMGAGHTGLQTFATGGAANLAAGVRMRKYIQFT